MLVCKRSIWVLLLIHCMHIQFLVDFVLSSKQISLREKTTWRNIKEKQNMKDYQNQAEQFKYLKLPSRHYQSRIYLSAAAWRQSPAQDLQNFTINASNSTNSLQCCFKVTQTNSPSWDMHLQDLYIYAEVLQTESGSDVQASHPLIEFPPIRQRKRKAGGSKIMRRPENKAGRHCPVSKTHAETERPSRLESPALEGICVIVWHGPLCQMAGPWREPHPYLSKCHHIGWCRAC